jgi:hypothetical protein
MLWVVVASFFLTAPIFAQGMMRIDRRLAGEEFVPEPRLIMPTAEVVDLTGKESLKFEWSPHQEEVLRFQVI